jgi:hypothetical protein
MFDLLGALHRLPAIENGSRFGPAFGGAMVLGIHSSKSWSRFAASRVRTLAFARAHQAHSATAI